MADLHLVDLVTCDEIRPELVQEMLDTLAESSSDPLLPDELVALIQRMIRAGLTNPEINDRFAGTTWRGRPITARTVEYARQLAAGTKRRRALAGAA